MPLPENAFPPYFFAKMKDFLLALSGVLAFLLCPKVPIFSFRPWKLFFLVNFPFL